MRTLATWHAETARCRLVLGLVVVMAGILPAAGNAQHPVTFSQNISPILQRSCETCHRPGAWGLRVAWLVYRGSADQVSFDPYQFKTYLDYRYESPWTPGWEPPPLPSDGRFPVTVSFRTPGTFVVRAQAHDGDLKDTEDVTVMVIPR